MTFTFKGASNFVIADLISKVIPFLMIPYLTSSLGMAGFGDLSLFHAIAGGCLVFLNVGFDSALSRYYVKYGRRGYVSLFFLCFSYVLIVVILVSLIMLLGGLDKVYYFALLYAALCTLQAMLLSYFVISKSVMFYWVLCVFSSFLSAVFTVVFFELYQSTVLTRAWSLVLGLLFLVMAFVYFLLRSCQLRSFVCRPQILYLFSFCLPIFPHNLTVFFRGYADRFFIDSHYSPSDLGVYSLAVQLSAVGLLFIQSIYRAFLPLLFNKLKEGVSFEILRLNLYITLIVLTALSLLVFVIVYSLPEYLYVFLFGSGAESVGLYLSVLVIAIVWQVMYLILGGILVYLAETAYVASISIVVSLIHIGLLAVFIDVSMISAAIINALTLIILVFFLMKRVFFRWRNE